MTRLLGIAVTFLAFMFATGLLFVVAWPMLLIVPLAWFFISRNARRS